MPRVHPGPPCAVCGQPSVAKKLCATHYKRMARHGRVDFGRPADWGKRAVHPLNECWSKMYRSGGRVPRWDDFWAFVADVGERPTAKHTLRRMRNNEPIGPDNWYWCEPVSDFGKPKDKELLRAYAKAWRAKNPLRAKNQSLKRAFGITLADFDAMLAEQGGVCAICGRERDEHFNLAVDHCHKTGKIRQLLCAKCNQGIGCFRDDPVILCRAIAYLERHLEQAA